MARKEVAPILAKDFRICKIDTDRMIGGEEMLKAHRKGKDGGIPWFEFLDADGAALADSNGPKGNIGSPNTDEEIETFLGILKKVVVAIGEEDLAALRKALLANQVK